MTAERNSVGFDTEYPLYSGLYKSLIRYIDVSDIVSPAKPALCQSSVASFTRSLAEHGFLRPVYLTKDGLISDGRKRFAAARALGAKRIPCVVSPTPLVFEDDLLILKLRTERIGFFESADVLSVLTRSYLYSQEEVAAALGRSQSFIANRLRLLAFTDEERKIVEENSLTERHCRAVLKIKDPSARRASLEAIAASSMSVSAAEEYAARAASSEGAGRAAGLRRDLDSLISSYSEITDVCSSSSVSPDGSIVYTIKIPR